MKQNRGFTLIELLVVVLIIGILAAVALPQYQKAIKKSRATEAILNLRKIKEAQNSYYLANGKSTVDLSQLDIEIKEKFYRYACNEVPFSTSGECFAFPKNESGPIFEERGYLWCRGTAEQCKNFSTIPDNRFGPGEFGPYWIIEEN